MGYTTIRVSNEAVAELRRRASEDDRPMVKVLDRLLGVRRSGESTRPGPRAKRVESSPVAEPAEPAEAAVAPTHASESEGVRNPELRCQRCRQPWRLHQAGSRGNRAPVTGCTTFTEG